jgi:hypothetical protein
MAVTGRPPPRHPSARYRARVTAQDLAIADAPDARRYEAHLGEELAGFVDYRLAGTRRILLHTEVPPAFGGRGIGAALARHILDEARTTGIRVTVKCPFIQAYLVRHPEYADIVTFAPAPAPRPRGP